MQNTVNVKHLPKTPESIYKLIETIRMDKSTGQTKGLNHLKWALPSCKLHKSIFPFMYYIILFFLSFAEMEMGWVEIK